ncbi:hypothetical protein, partial [Lysinibacillus sp. LK3]|uniref:hypothetical protein n=1 Tax=Lysinibacillus sp. LK3 TaxID=1628207 RepID=UPI000653C8DB
PELIHYLKFLDLKEGLHSYNPYYDNLIKYLFENSFVGESFSTFENTLEDFYEKIDQEKLLSKKEKEKNKEYIIRPLSSNPLEKFDLKNIIEKYMENMNATKDTILKNKYSEELSVFLDFKKNLLDFQRYELEKISKEIYEYSIAYNNHLVI